MTAVIVFAKAPIAGQVKTRLCPALSASAAARLYERMLEHTVREACRAELGPVWLYAAPSPAHPSLRRLSRKHGLRTAEQRGADLGERMCRAMREVLADSDACVLIGADCPGLEARDLCAAAAALRARVDLVLGPTADGGYVLIGARDARPELFTDIAWSTSSVARETLARAERLGLRAQRLRWLRDIDRACDLALVPRDWRLPPR